MLMRLRLTGAAFIAAAAIVACGHAAHHHHHAAPAARTVPGPNAAMGSVAPPGWGKPGPLTFTLTKPVPSKLMYDSVDTSQIPRSSFAVAGYPNGYYRTWPTLLRSWPHAHHVSVAISAAYRGVCLDIEPGDAAPDQAAGWVRAERRAGVKRPCLYSSYWEFVTQVRPDLAAAHIARGSVLEWDADYTGSPGITPSFDATQWTDHALGRNLDASTVSYAFLREALPAFVPPAPRPRDLGGAEHYERWPTRPVNERAAVERWDAEHCANPVRRGVCVHTHAEMARALARDQALYQRDSRRLADKLRLPGRIQGLVHRLSGTGHVTRWL